VKVAAFIGIDIGASTGVQIENGPRILTPWGYLAWQIGGNDAYVMVETEDQQRIAPTMFSGKCLAIYLLLLDEFLSTLKMRWGC